MTQEYTPVSWQDETTSQQGTLINAERLNQMQTAHHFADGFEEVDAVPTADPGVDYHKIVYCTADSTLYRWDGTEWTKDIDDETKRLLEEEIARATQAESTLLGQLEDEHDARVDAEAAINDRITDEATELAQRIATETSTRYTADTALGTRITNEATARESADTNLGNRITAEATARAEADTLLGGRIDTEQARAEAAEQANAQAIANTYTKAEADTRLAGKASTTAVQTLDTRVGALETGLADTYNKTETDTLLASKADQATTYTKTEVQTYVSNALDSYAPMVRTTGNQPIAGTKTFTSIIVGSAPGKYIGICGPTQAASGQFYKMAEIDNLSNNEGVVFTIFAGLNGSVYTRATYRVYRAGGALYVQCLDRCYTTIYQKTKIYGIISGSGVIIYANTLSWCRPYLYLNYWENQGEIYASMAQHTLILSDDWSIITPPADIVEEVKLTSD